MKTSIVSVHFISRSCSVLYPRSIRQSTATWAYLGESVPRPICLERAFLIDLPIRELFNQDEDYKRVPDILNHAVCRL
ncbi:hypothetical protein BKA56DRAFT_306158 [Ilyonectria sp. MPI-CAGE-AT-0026]|nr:hypothetical protein BKA56DRAFT_306158 [Ilyonectria sp. MPI-CAGE-AT-0026]